MKDVILQTLKLNESHDAAITAQRTELSERDRKVLNTLRESAAFQSLPKEEIDRHTIRHILCAITVEPVSYIEALSKKVANLIEDGSLPPDLAQTLTEDHQADADPENLQKVDDQGMYGVGDGADKPSPKGPADKGAEQNDDSHGDSSKTASKGALDEFDDVADPEHNQPKGDDDKKGVNEEMPDFIKKKIDAKKGKDDSEMDEDFEEEVQKDAPSADSDDERAANDATYKDGKGQNESEDGQKGPVMNHKPKAVDPGEPKAGTSKSKPETPDADTPDYAKAKQEDPSNWEGNKGPAQAVNESFSEIEESILKMLESAGFVPGSERWTELYCKGFAHALSERASALGKHLAERKNCEQDMDYDDEAPEVEPEEKKK
jgi:hypothetical protein